VTTAERMGAQLLIGSPAGDPVAVVERILAVQAQDQRGFRLAIRARSRGLVAADVDRALTVDRTVVVSWLNRGTLHLVRREDYWWLHALTAPPILPVNATRLGNHGISEAIAERGVGVIADAVAADGPLTRAELAERLASSGVPTEGQALVQLLVLASLRGSIVRGPVVGREQAFALARDWVGPPEPVDRSQALAELARRYLAGHGPADDRDLAKWAGLPLRDARAGLASIAPSLRERPDGLVELRGRRATGQGGPRLLGAFDPLLHGWDSRESIVGAGTGIVTNNGIFRPFALVDGRAAATWTLTNGVVQLKPFDELAPTDLEALAADAVDVLRFLGLPGAPMRT
jgi:Winged helix DNA-binding domain